MLINTICNHLAERIEAGQLNNDEIVQIIELCGSYLNLRTISDYAKEENISYNGAKKFRNPIVIFNTKYIIDNE